ncbi:unnamed protein product [Schistosoma spindalis]|nr:unnamed protein product [Schistosoma spindale]
MLLGLNIFNRINSIKYQFQVLSELQKNNINQYDPSDSPFIFIGGHQSTGKLDFPITLNNKSTGLMRILMDIHPLVRCGPEPVVTRELLRYRRHLETMSDLLSQSGITENLLDDASAAFIATIIQEMGPQAPRLCHKDPSSFIYLEELADIFPKAKFIHMLRDGRAAIASTIQNINSNYTSENITEAILTWDELTTQILEDCEYIGSEKCLTIRYECLVLNPLREIQKVLHFLELPWDEKLLKYGTEFSRTDQLIHNSSLDAWSEANSLLSEEYIKFMNENSLALKQLNYLTDKIPPNYATICNI